MEADRLAQLGLTVDEAGGGLEAVLALDRAVVNPLTRAVRPEVTFALAEDRLIPVEPPELVGLPPLSVAELADREELEAQLWAAFEEHVGALDRRLGELQALGIQARVDPESLEIQGELELGPLRFVLGGDKRGNLQITQIYRAGALVGSDVGPPFDPSGFGGPEALGSWLRGQAGAPVEPQTPLGLGYGELLERFGAAARVPPRSGLEVIVDFRVRGERFRFVAARVRGRLFRALLAGPDGKKWGDHFNLEDFTGVGEVAVRVLGVEPGEIEWLGAEAEE
jgi:hypothetical protein